MVDEFAQDAQESVNIENLAADLFQQQTSEMEKLAAEVNKNAAGMEPSVSAPTPWSTDFFGEKEGENGSPATPPTSNQENAYENGFFQGGATATQTPTVGASASTPTVSAESTHAPKNETVMDDTPTQAGTAEEVHETPNAEATAVNTGVNNQATQEMSFPNSFSIVADGEQPEPELKEGQTRSADAIAISDGASTDSMDSPKNGTEVFSHNISPQVKPHEMDQDSVTGHSEPNPRPHPESSFGEQRNFDNTLEPNSASGAAYPDENANMTPYISDEAALQNYQGEKFIGSDHWKKATQTLANAWDPSRPGSMDDLIEGTFFGLISMVAALPGQYLDHLEAEEKKQAEFLEKAHQAMDEDTKKKLNMTQSEFQAHTAKQGINGAFMTQLKDKNPALYNALLDSRGQITPTQAKLLGEEFPKILRTNPEARKQLEHTIGHPISDKHLEYLGKLIQDNPQILAQQMSDFHAMQEKRAEQDAARTATETVEKLPEPPQSQQQGVVDFRPTDTPANGAAPTTPANGVAPAAPANGITPDTLTNGAAPAAPANGVAPAVHHGNLADAPTSAEEVPALHAEAQEAKNELNAVAEAQKKVAQDTKDVSNARGQEAQPKTQQPVRTAGQDGRE